MPARSLRVFAAALCLGLAVPVLAAQQVAVDPSLPDYVPHQKVAGNVIGYSGMDTVERMMAAWNAAFRRFHPDAHFSVVQKDGLGPERP